jgi:hypothetical protein
MSNMLRTISRSVARYEGTTVRRVPRNTVGRPKGPRQGQSLTARWRGRPQVPPTPLSPYTGSQAPRKGFFGRVVSALGRAVSALRGR